MRHSFIAAAAAALAATNADAHDFWLSVGEYRQEAQPSSVDVSLLIGHAGEKAPWGGGADRIVRAQIAENGKKRSLRASIDQYNSEQAAFQFDGLVEGTHILRLDTNDAFIELPAKKFDAYVAEEGLTEIAVHRSGPNAADMPGRELYSRNAKAIVQVGAEYTGVSRRLGQTLELVPLKNPYALPPGEDLPIAVYYKGARAAGVSVHLESLSLSIVPEVTRISNENGVASFPVPRKGAWKIDAVWGEPADDERADYRTVFSSLTFGY
jgi:uncharacterized GH25 family protein